MITSAKEMIRYIAIYIYIQNKIVLHSKSNCNYASDYRFPLGTHGASREDKQRENGHTSRGRTLQEPATSAKSQFERPKV